MHNQDNALPILIIIINLGIHHTNVVHAQMHKRI